MVLHNLTKCTWTWTTQNGVNGRLVTGPNGKTMFLPAAGYRDGSSHNDTGSIGYYWTRKLFSGRPVTAYYVNFDSGGVYWYGSHRLCGFTVRAVRVQQR